MKIYRSERYKMVGGVCAGIGLSQNTSISLIRLLALFLLSTSGVGLFIYIVCWVLLPSYRESPIPEPESPPRDFLLRSRSDRKIAGVCGGLAKFLGVDAGLLRVLWVLTVLFFGVGLLPYLYAWLVLPEDV